MVCCALISLVIAALLWPLRKLVALFRPAKMGALQWQLCPIDVVAPTSQAKFSFTARAQSVRYALDGLGFVLRNEHNARIHIAAGGVVFSLGFLLHIKSNDWMVLVIAIMSVWFAETINTAFEHLCDVVSPEQNQSVGKAKDIAAGAVLITAIGAAIIGTLTLAPYVTEALSGHAHMLAMT